MKENESLKEVVIMYHANCRDGFGAAYAAWKKFGDAASYIPVHQHDKLPEGLQGKEVYIVDFSFTRELLEKLATENDSVVVIDHHVSAKEDVTAFPENIYDNDHSGAYLAWQYFHPEEAMPRLLLYIEDHDLWNFKLEHTREIGAALGEYSMDFETWDTLNRNFDDKTWFDSFINHGSVIAGYEDRLVRDISQYRELVKFEGLTCYAVNAERIYRSPVGHELAKISEAEGHAPMGIVYYRYRGKIHCSLRSNGDCDVSEIAVKYGGGGHKNAASIHVDDFSKLPFSFK